MMKEELESSTIQFFTESIKNAVADDRKRTPKRNHKKDLHKPVLYISQKKENDQEDDSDVHSKVDDTHDDEENHYIVKNNHDGDGGGNKGDDDLSDDIV